jgi:hypothetical protein
MAPVFASDVIAIMHIFDPMWIAERILIEKGVNIIISRQRIMWIEYVYRALRTMALA